MSLASPGGVSATRASRSSRGMQRRDLGPQAKLRQLGGSRTSSPLKNAREGPYSLPVDGTEMALEVGAAQDGVECVEGPELVLGGARRILASLPQRQAAIVNWPSNEGVDVHTPTAIRRRKATREKIDSDNENDNHQNLRSTPTPFIAKELTRESAVESSATMKEAVLLDVQQSEEALLRAPSPLSSSPAGGSSITAKSALVDAPTKGGGGLFSWPVDSSGPRTKRRGGAAVPRRAWPESGNKSITREPQLITAAAAQATAMDGVALLRHAGSGSRGGAVGLVVVPGQSPTRGATDSGARALPKATRRPHPDGGGSPATDTEEWRRAKKRRYTEGRSAAANGDVGRASEDFTASGKRRLTAPLTAITNTGRSIFSSIFNSGGRKSAAAEIRSESQQQQQPLQESAAIKSSPQSQPFASDIPTAEPARPVGYRLQETAIQAAFSAKTPFGSSVPGQEPPPYALLLHDLAASNRGGEVLWATDQFFSSAARMLSPLPPQLPRSAPERVAQSDQYGLPRALPPTTSLRPLHDAWLTRRRRIPGHDWCLIALWAPGVVRGLDIETSYLSGNHAPFVSVEGANLPELQTQLSDAAAEVEEVEGEIRTLAEESGRCQGGSDAAAKLEDLEKKRENLVADVDALLESHSKHDRNQWVDILPMTELRESPEPPTSHQGAVDPSPSTSTSILKSCQSCHNYFSVDVRDQKQMARAFTHLRLNLFPDGGVSRFRVFGEVRREGASEFTAVALSPTGMSRPTSRAATAPPRDSLLNLTAAEDGSVALVCSDQGLGTPSNLLLTKAGIEPEADCRGWLTARNHLRPPVLFEGSDGKPSNLVGSEWVVIKLSARGAFPSSGAYIEVDTSSFLGEAPMACAVEGCDLPEISCRPVLEQMRFFETTCHRLTWKPILRRTELRPNSQNFFSLQSETSVQVCTHIRFVIYPDGGIRRLRLWSSAVP